MFRKILSISYHPIGLYKTRFNGISFKIIRYLSEMKILNVAEKNDAAKNIAFYLAERAPLKREGFSKFNKIYEFDKKVFNQNCKMIMTSVSGHLMNLEFNHVYRVWNKVNPLDLFQAPILKFYSPANENIKKTLQREVKSCFALIIWTDCDREGENIGFEIIDCCKEVKPTIKIYRARFSEITKPSVERALQNLDVPNECLNNAVNVRSELDLRIGAAFTRFQCLTLQKAFPSAFKETLVSYGSCQFPTLGFVVERFKAIAEFVSEKFWSINVTHKNNNLEVDFEWKRHRLFDKLACEVLYDKCKESSAAKIEKVEKKPKLKWRPKPLDTVELEKLSSRKLKINAKETLKIAEKLYSQGLISYPRTETNIFPKEINLVSLVEKQTSDPNWGGFAKRVLNDGPNPFQGKKTDNAHPPIHPTKYCNNLLGNEKRVYELVTRHFLACVSMHAEGLETIVDIDVAKEKFTAKGLVITAKNYLEVYPYEVWSDREIHSYQVGDTFTPDISMNEGGTSPPELLTEADLISLMEKHGIGTDATHAEHIETIKARLYVGLKNNKYFVPRTLGMGLVEAYNSMGYAMAKPDLRAELEADLKRICENQISADEVLNRHIQNYLTVYKGVQNKVKCLYETLQDYIQVEALPVGPQQFSFNTWKKVMDCPSCSSPMHLHETKKKAKYIGCSNYPKCRRALWLSSIVKEVTPTEDVCPKCGPNNRLLRFKFETGTTYLPENYLGCVGGCDPNLLNILNSNRQFSNSNNENSVIPTTSNVENESNDSGISSFNESSPGTLKLNDPIKCNCNSTASRFTVKKEGPNKGKRFYKCSSDKSCNFFKWEEEINLKEQNTLRAREENILSNDMGDEEMRCYCAKPCRKLVVSKEGPNKGKEFYCCSIPSGGKNSCNFFKWV